MSNREHLTLKKVYKEKQFLIFVLSDGGTVKYDFATHTCIGKKGNVVKNLNTQLTGITIYDTIEKCVDKNYAKFLLYIRDNQPYEIYQLGTVLSRIENDSNIEQIFSAGYENIIYLSGFKYKTNDIPKGLIKLAKEKNIKITNKLVTDYKKHPDLFKLAYELDYISLNEELIDSLLFNTKRDFDYSINRTNNFLFYDNKLIELIEEYYYYTQNGKIKYNYKDLLLYLDRLYTFEALDIHAYNFIRELKDYLYMVSSISKKCDKYPKNFLTTHQITCRNYERLKREYPEELFKNRINLDYEYKKGNYIFIYPKCVQDIKDEAVQQNNCVASYIDKVIDRKCHILFLRKKDEPYKSLVTIEVQNNKIIQAKRAYNDPILPEEKEAVDAWNKKFEKYKIK